MTIELHAAYASADVVHIRALEDTDRNALCALNEHVSDRTLYRRFFSMSHYAADAYVDQLLRPASADHQVLVGLVDRELVGVASYERVDSASAEVALLIEDRY